MSTEEVDHRFVFAAENPFSGTRWPLRASEDLLIRKAYIWNWSVDHGMPDQEKVGRRPTLQEAVAATGRLYGIKAGVA